MAELQDFHLGLMPQLIHPLKFLYTKCFQHLLANNGHILILKERLHFLLYHKAHSFNYYLQLIHTNKLFLLGIFGKLHKPK